MGYTISLAISFQMFGLVNFSLQMFTLKTTVSLAIVMIFYYHLPSQAIQIEDIISVMFYFLIYRVKSLELKSNLAFLAEGCGECYQLFLFSESKSCSMTSWHRAEQSHISQTELNKEGGRNEHL